MDTHGDVFLAVIHVWDSSVHQVSACRIQMRYNFKCPFPLNFFLRECRGSMLATHVDRDPLITSAIINIGQEVAEPWPLELYDHDGRAHNVTMQPGDMVLYESHSVLHGRPFPLNGTYFANIFVHFKPVFDSKTETDREL